MMSDYDYIPLEPVYSTSAPYHRRKSGSIFAANPFFLNEDPASAPTFKLPNGLPIALPSDSKRCERCENYYREIDNTKGCCQYHVGEFKVVRP